MANHHYVPRFYLRHFACDSGESRVFSMNQNNEIHKNKISDICSQKNYNTRDQEAEQSKLEKAFAGILRNMIAPSNPVDNDLYLGFLTFVGFMLANNIKKRKNIAESISSFELQIEGLDTNHKILIGNDHRARFDLSLAFSNAFFQEFRSWNFIRREIGDRQKVFITSDDPVSIFNPENLLSHTHIAIEWKIPTIESYEEATFSGNESRTVVQASFPLENVSFERDVMMIFPITPFSCLIGFSDSDRYARFAEATMNSADINDLINTITFRYSNKAAYSPSEERLKETMTQLPRVLPM